MKKLKLLFSWLVITYCVTGCNKKNPETVEETPPKLEMHAPYEIVVTPLSDTFGIGDETGEGTVENLVIQDLSGMKIREQLPYQIKIWKNQTDSILNPINIGRENNGKEEKISFSCTGTVEMIKDAFGFRVWVVENSQSFSIEIPSVKESSIVCYHIIGSIDEQNYDGYITFLVQPEK